MSLTPEQVAAMLDDAKVARKEVSALCNGKSWRMCVPVEDADSDMVLCKAIDHVRALAAEVSRLLAEQTKWREAGLAAAANLGRMRDELEALRKERDEYVSALNRANELLRYHMKDSCDEHAVSLDWCGACRTAKHQFHVAEEHLFSVARAALKAGGKCDE